MVSGSKDLLAGSNSLKEGTAELYGKTSELSDGVNDLISGISELHDGTNELRNETDSMDSEISDKIDEMLDSISGDGNETVSFVSEKNTNVKSVQFVIQTESIEIAEADNQMAEIEESLTLWQKLLRLFGLY